MKGLPRKPRPEYDWSDEEFAKRWGKIVAKVGDPWLAAQWLQGLLLAAVKAGHLHLNIQTDVDLKSSENYCDMSFYPDPDDGGSIDGDSFAMGFLMDPKEGAHNHAEVEKAWAGLYITAAPAE